MDGLFTVRDLEMELETAEQRIEDLEKDLVLNARMLAKQTDEAREAEFQASILQERVETLEAAIAAIRDILHILRLYRGGDRDA